MEIKRLAKNTLLLYFRMFLNIIASLFSVRLLFNALGVVDYGIYTLISGFVLMLAFVKNTMIAASQRYFSYELGMKNKEKLKFLFSLNIEIYIVVSILLFAFAETIGFWLLNYKLVIPMERIEAANVVYQLSVFGFVFDFIFIPYLSMIIAYEKMSLYALGSIVESILKVVAAVLLGLFINDRLIVYAIFFLIITVIVDLIYWRLCKRYICEARFNWVWDKDVFSDFLSYTGWNIFEPASFVVKNQGINILLNMFFGAVVNSARAISFQVNSLLEQLSGYFYISLRPQIIKCYSCGNLNDMFNLILYGSKYCFYLLFIIALPLLFKISYILDLWLGGYPVYTVGFVRLIVLSFLIDSISVLQVSIAHATKEVKRFQTIVSLFLVLNLPISYMLLKCNFPAYFVFVVGILMSVICLFIRAYISNKIIGFPLSRFFKEVVANCLLVAFPPLLICLVLNPFSKLYFSGFLGFLLFCLVSLISSVSSCYVLGLSSTEKSKVKKYVQCIILRK